MDSMLLGVVALWKQFLAVIFIIVCILLIIIVLLQKGRGGGLAAAFGGAGGQSAFGSKTGDVFTWITIVFVGVFLFLAVVLTMVYTDIPEIDDAATTQSLAETEGLGGAASPAVPAAGSPVETIPPASVPTPAAEEN